MFDPTTNLSPVFLAPAPVATNELVSAIATASVEQLTELLNELYQSPSDAIYQQTIDMGGVDPKANNRDWALHQRVTPLFTRALLGGPRNN